jgi:hypothetical protein
MANWTYGCDSLSLSHRERERERDMLFCVVIELVCFMQKELEPSIICIEKFVESLKNLSGG